jgi:tetratricopeptide (TPR) repeat protein
MKDSPQIFTFYSFKGGVGRSMAVLNLAYALAAKGRQVLVLDMDLEAPGLSGFLHREAEIAGFARLDMVNLVSWAFSAHLPLDPVSFPPASDYVVPIAPEKLEQVPRSFSELGRLDIIPVEEERDYYERLTSLAMGNYDQDDLVRAGSVLRAWLKELRFPVDVPDYHGPACERTASYDYVLVDSRTGITETGGLCIGPLSDQLVVLTALNDQNVAGTRKFLTEVGVLDGGVGPGSKPYLIVASLVPTGEIEKKQQRLSQIEKDLGKAVVKLSYHPQLALKETIFTRDHTDEYLAREYEELLQQILRMAGDWVNDETFLRVTSDQHRTSAAYHEALRQLIGLAWIPGLEPFLSHLFLATNFAEISDDSDYVLWDRLSRVLSLRKSPLALSGVNNNRANLLSQWARKSTDPELAALRRDAAMNQYEEILQSDDVPPDQKALALNNRGVAFLQLAESEKAMTDFSAVIEMPNATAKQKAVARLNLGMLYSERGEPEKAIADYTAVIGIHETPREQKSQAFYSRGAAYHKINEPDQAIADFTAVIEMADLPIQQKAIALCTRGWSHFLAGRYHEAAQDEREAAALMPAYWTAHANLAIALLAKGETGQALLAYKTAIDLADLKNLDEMADDLRNLTLKLGRLPGAEDALARIEVRKQSLSR